MKRGKAPPIDLQLTKAERLHRIVFKDRGPLPVSAANHAWLEKNCLRCEHRNIERMVTAALLQTEMYWKHICTHRGPTRRLSYQERKEKWEKMNPEGDSFHSVVSRGHASDDCSGFEPAETSQILP